MAECVRDPNPLRCLCHCYSATQVSLKISALEAAGFDVFAPWYHTASNQPHMMLALGGVPILVPKSQADEALALLKSIAETQEAAEPDPPVAAFMPGRSFWRYLWLFVMYKVGIGPSLDLTFLAEGRDGRPGRG